ncbi:MAG: anti-sigma factor [Planctomycetota bacterium]|nr:anti-sigma factor [Planctomycetota bacterium]
MTGDTQQNRIDDLLIEKAVFGLDASQTKELETLIANPANKNHDAFEIAATLVDVSMIKMETMPTKLKQTIIAQGQAELTPRSGPQSTQRVQLKNDHVGATQGSSSGFSKIREVVAWASAIAVGFFAFGMWQENVKQDVQVSKLNVQVSKLKTGTAGLESKYQELSAQTADLQVKNQELSARATDLQAKNQELSAQLFPNGKTIYDRIAGQKGAIKWAWSATGNSKASGDVVWNQAEQKGAMRFVNLEKNDPAVSQYQLWIIEESGRKHPVDGGVFDAQSDIEIFIPIDSKLFANPPKAFAVTIENKHGVVVSNRENLPLIAMASPGKK